MRARPEGDAIERRLARYRPEIQPPVRRLAARHAWIADLALSFPALLFALAVPRKGTDADAAARLVMSGAPLARAAMAAGAPMWMRSFPHEALRRLIRREHRRQRLSPLQRSEER
jgi:hypothetical protein